MTDSNAMLLLDLLQTQRTLVLATADPEPWSAPVYYTYVHRRFYFFSSPRSRHITAALAADRCAASIFRDSSNWRDIEGAQMDGTVQRIPMGAEALGAYGNYVRKFPTVREFFTEAAFDLGQFLDRFRTQLYAFVPRQVFYLNNRAGLGKRCEVELPA
jgi:uncharacterized protein YhbP (UPF0306 family)